MAKKKPNFNPYGNKRSGRIGIGGTKNSKGQSGSGGNSRKTHDTKGKNTQGRNKSWF